MSVSSPGDDYTFPLGILPRCEHSPVQTACSEPNIESHPAAVVTVATYETDGSAIPHKSRAAD